MGGEGLEGVCLEQPPPCFTLRDVLTPLPVEPCTIAADGATRFLGYLQGVDLDPSII